MQKLKKRIRFIMINFDSILLSGISEFGGNTTTIPF